MEVINALPNLNACWVEGLLKEITQVIIHLPINCGQSCVNISYLWSLIHLLFREETVFHPHLVVYNHHVFFLQVIHALGSGTWYKIFAHGAQIAG